MFQRVVQLLWRQTGEKWEKLKSNSHCTSTFILICTEVSCLSSLLKQEFLPPLCKQTEAFKGLYVLPASFTKIVSMSKMLNIYFKHLLRPGKEKPTRWPEKLFTTSLDPALQFSCPLRRKWRTSASESGCKEFVARPAANSSTVTLHELHRVWPPSTPERFSLSTNECAPVSSWCCAKSEIQARATDTQRESRWFCNQEIKGLLCCPHDACALALPAS